MVTVRKRRRAKYRRQQERLVDIILGFFRFCLLPGASKESLQILQHSISALRSPRIAQLVNHYRENQGKNNQETDVVLSPLEREYDFVRSGAQQKNRRAGKYH